MKPQLIFILQLKESPCQDHVPELKSRRLLMGFPFGMLPLYSDFAEGLLYHYCFPAALGRADCRDQGSNRTVSGAEMS